MGGVIELKINTTTIGSTTIEAKLNGSVFASGTIDITAGVARLLFGSNNSDITFDHTFANIIINDNQGGEMDDYVGDAYINHLQIDGQVGTPQFTIGGSSPAASNYQSVNDGEPMELSEEVVDEFMENVPMSVRLAKLDRKSTRLNSSHRSLSRMPSSA